MRIEKIDVLGSAGRVELLKHNNNDLTVVNAARESFAKQKQTLDDTDIRLIGYLAKHNHWTPFGHVCYVRRVESFSRHALNWIVKTQKNNFSRVMVESFEEPCVFFEQGSLYAFIKNYLRPVDLAANNSANALIRANRIHEDQNLLPAATFEEDLFNAFEFPCLEASGGLTATQLAQLTTATLRFKMPIFVERQWSTHKQDLLLGRPEQITRNEMSGRYVTLPNEFFVPPKWRLKAENVKQGSSDQTVENYYENVLLEKPILISDVVASTCEDTYDIYQKLLEKEIAPEVARMILPANVCTEFWETGTLAAWARVVRLRCDPHAQKEVREYAEAVSEHLGNLWGGLWTEILQARAI